MPLKLSSALLEAASPGKVLVRHAAALDLREVKSTATSTTAHGQVPVQSSGAALGLCSDGAEPWPGRCSVAPGQWTASVDVYTDSGFPPLQQRRNVRPCEDRSVLLPGLPFVCHRSAGIA